MSSRNILIVDAAYGTVQQRKNFPIQEIKADDMETRKRRMVRIPNRYGEEEGIRMNPDSSDGIYVTTSVESQCRLISQNRKMKDEDKIKNTKVNALKRAARMNQRAKYFLKLVANLPNEMVNSGYPSTPSSSKSSYPSQPTSSRTPISILAEIWVSCLI